MSDKLLNAMHETAKGLHQSGVMDTMTMRELNALCLNRPGNSGDSVV